MIPLDNSLPIQNFPSNYPWYKRLGSNITFCFSQLPLWKRKNSLTREDIRWAKQTIRTGDIILVGWFKHVSWLFIEGIVTHALAYTGRWHCIHAFAHGVSYIGIKKVLRMYDTYIILRPQWKSKEQIGKFRSNLINELGQPYDFFFWLEETGEKIYFCTRLINDALLDVGYNTGLKSIRKPENILDETLDEAFRAHRILLPDEMIYGNWNIVAHSANISYDTVTAKYILTKWKRNLLTN